MGHRIGTSHEGLGHDSALDPRRHRSLALGRRTLLSGLGLGVTAGVVGLTAPAASGASRPRVPTGFAVGSRVPQMQGLDQFGAATKLVDGSSWTMIDACAWWCDPCRRSATLHHAFSDYLHSQGVAFRLVSVIEQDFDGAVANGSDAESWAWHYDLERDRVMHPGGDAASPLAQVSSRFADAAGVANAIPCYVLLDPAGVVRVYERGYVTERQGQWIATMNAMQSVIGAATGKSLDRVWDVDSLSAASPRQTGLVSYARAHAVGATVLHGAFDVTLDGGQDHETAGVGLAEGSLHTVGDPGTPGFDLDTPLRMDLSGASFPPGIPLELVLAPQLVGEHLVGGEWVNETVDLPTTVVQVSDAAATISVPDPRGLVSHIPDHREWNFWLLSSGVTYTLAYPYHASTSISALTTADTSLGETTRSTVLKALNGVRSMLAQRRFADAAAKSRAAQKALGDQGSADLRRLVAALATWLTDVAVDGVSPASAPARTREPAPRR